jgi:hypothetical protein
MLDGTNPAKLIALSSVLLSAVIAGCASFGPRNQGPVFDRVTLNIQAVGHEGDANTNQWVKICDVLSRYGMVDCANYERTNCQQVGSVRVCDFENITLSFSPPLSLKCIGQLHDDLVSLKNQGVTLGLVNGSFVGAYASLTAEGTVSIKVKISVTPGATLYLEHRWAGICEKVPTPGNVFHDEITLRPGQEWIYYRTELGTGGGLVRRYFRLNVSTRQPEELSAKEFDRLLKQP